VLTPYGGAKIKTVDARILFRSLSRSGHLCLCHFRDRGRERHHSAVAIGPTGDAELPSTQRPSQLAFGPFSCDSTQAAVTFCDYLKIVECKRSARRRAQLMGPAAICSLHMCWRDCHSTEWRIGLRHRLLPTPRPLGGYGCDNTH